MAVPTTIVTYAINGSLKDFPIPFEYLARKFVVVTLIGAGRTELVLNTDFRFSTPTQITTLRGTGWGPGDGYTAIEIRRLTSTTERLVDFTDGSILRAFDMNLSTIQAIHIAGEARDLLFDAVSVNDQGIFSARGKEILQVGAPTTNESAARKIDVDQAESRLSDRITAIVTADQRHIQVPVSDGTAKILPPRSERVNKIVTTDGNGDFTFRTPNLNSQEELIAFLASGEGSFATGFKRKPTTLNRAIQTAGDYLQVHDIHLQEFAYKVVDDDWSYAFEEAFKFGAAFPGPGAGGRLRLGGGRFGLRRQVDIPFGWSLIGTSSDFYGTTLTPLGGFVGTWMCKFTSVNTSYNNGHWDSISMDMENATGLNCLLFEGAYRSTSIKNSVFRNVAYNAAGLIVRPMTGPGKTSICESVLISDVYVIKDSSTNQTVNGIQLYSVQESTLLNVKCFHAGNPATTRGGAAIYMEDCRGVTTISGGVVGAAYGIHLHAKTRNCTGITILGMTWENNGSANIKTSGENGFLVAGVDVPTMRTEFPAVPLALDLQGNSGGHYFVGSANVKAAADCNNVIIEGSGVGTKDIAVGAQVTFIDRGNAVNKAYRVSPLFEIYSVSNPQFSLSVNGQTGTWRTDWNANSVTDNGMRIRSPLGNTIATYTDAGFGPLTKFQSRIYINADNTPSMQWEVNGRSGRWNWEWSATSATDNGMRLVSPEGRTTFSARDNGTTASIGFFDGIRASRQDIAGNLASSDIVLKRVVQVLAAYGLITNSTTG